MVYIWDMCDTLRQPIDIIVDHHIPMAINRVAIQATVLGITTGTIMYLSLRASINAAYCVPIRRKSDNQYCPPVNNINDVYNDRRSVKDILLDKAVLTWNRSVINTHGAIKSLIFGTST
uniref:Uncharacterized protein n=1 Tax=Spongospora subterranea TaxID=70186 RepID=A0A0H5R591_9EUKA|eukprot:CRZ09298.1 hypothetical protein [Spongospora subterranea]